MPGTAKLSACSAFIQLLRGIPDIARPQKMLWDKLRTGVGCRNVPAGGVTEYSPDGRVVACSADIRRGTGCCALGPCSGQGRATGLRRVDGAGMRDLCGCILAP